MSFTPARTIAYAGRIWRTSRSSRARTSCEVSPLIPRFRTVHSGWDRIIQYAYWLSGFPLPWGGASSGERKPGVPAVVESPRPTIVRGRGAMDRPWIHREHVNHRLRRNPQRDDPSGPADESGPTSALGDRSNLYPNPPPSTRDGPRREADPETRRPARPAPRLSQGPGEGRRSGELEVSGAHAHPRAGRATILQRTSEPREVHAGGTGVHRQEDQRGARALRRRSEDQRRPDRGRGGEDPGGSADEQGHRPDDLRRTLAGLPGDEPPCLREGDRSVRGLRG